MGSKRMLTMLMGSQAEVLIKAAFTGWWEFVSHLKNERHIAQLRTNMSPKNAESSRRMLGMLMGARSEALVKLCFGGWKDVAGEAKAERIRQNNLKKRSKEDESRRRMLGMLVGSQSSLMMKTAFSGWQELIVTLKQERSVERMKALRMREQYGSMKSKGAESSRRMLGMLLGSQNGALLKACFSVWHELITKLRQEREMEQFQANMKSKGFEKNKRMLGMLATSQTATLLKAAFSGWFESATVARQERDMEMMKRSMKDTQAKRMLGMVMSTQGAALHKAAFAGWREFIVEEKQQKAIDKVRQEMKNKKNGNNKQLLGMLMGSQQSVVLRGSFSVWREHTEDARRAHQR